MKFFLRKKLNENQQRKETSNMTEKERDEIITFIAASVEIMDKKMARLQLLLIMNVIFGLVAVTTILFQ